VETEQRSHISFSCEAEFVSRFGLNYFIDFMGFTESCVINY
jgi:hypothetical protein